MVLQSVPKQVPLSSRPPLKPIPERWMSGMSCRPLPRQDQPRTDSPALHVARRCRRAPCCAPTAIPDFGNTRHAPLPSPHCDPDFRKPALAPPEAPSETPSIQVSLPIWGPPLPDTTPADRRLAWLSLVIAAIAPFANFATVIARLAPQLYVLLWMLSLGGVLLSVLAIYLARHAVRRIDNTQDKRGLMIAQWGLILG